MPSTSGRAATYPKRADKVKFFDQLKALRDRIRAEKGLAPANEEYCEAEDNTSNHNDIMPPEP